MDQICLVVPILPGRTADGRDFMRELEAGRRADYQHSEQRIGIVKEVWYLAQTPAGDQLVAYMESPDFPRALSMFHMFGISDPTAIRYCAEHTPASQSTSGR